MAPRDAAAGWATWRSLALINLAAIMERADEGLLPAVYREVGAAFRATPSQLGALTFARALVQAGASPLAGVLAARHDRAAVIGLGTLFWAASTVLVGLAQSYWQCAAARAINGIGLAVVIPALQSFIADSHAEQTRGAAFGWLNLVGTAGSIGGGMMATIMAANSYWGIAGWRAAFLLVAAVSAIIGWLVLVFVIDPRGHPKLQSQAAAGKGSSNLLQGAGNKSSRSMWRQMWQGMSIVLRVPTFQLIVAQGVVGSLPWQAMVFFTMWFQLVGFGHEGAATLMGIFSIGNAFGNYLGGWCGDRAARLFPDAGRIMCAQFSAFMGIPFSYLLLIRLPQSPEYYNHYAITLFFMGLLISWCQACANNPIFAEIVPTQHRTSIYAIDRAFEGSVAALAAPAVGILAERVFGYRADMVVPEEGSPQEARALSRGLFSCMAVPFGLCCLLFSTLYYTYSRDRNRASEGKKQGL
eukprot:SM000001S04644  [mRNA]  locus=s1:1445245:1447346:- [translate_table: standard]